MTYVHWGRGKPAAAVALVIFLFSWPQGASLGGLRTQFVEVQMFQLKVGHSYSLKRQKNLPLGITNSGKSRIRVEVTAVRPEKYELVGGYEPIPDPSWISFEKDHFTIEPNATGYTDVIISIPDDARLLGNSYQVVIASRTVDGMIGAGLRSRILLKIDSEP